jgi:hypothetical protein
MVVAASAVYGALLTQQFNWRLPLISWIFCTHILSVSAPGEQVSYIKSALRKSVTSLNWH